MSEAATREPHRLIAATVGVAIPRDRELYGYLSEHHSFGESEDIAGDYAEELAAEMLATTLGLEFDPDKSWDERRRSTGSRTRSSAPRTSRRPPSATRRASGRPSSPPPSSSAEGAFGARSRQSARAVPQHTKAHKSRTPIRQAYACVHRIRSRPSCPLYLLSFVSSRVSRPRAAS